MNGKHLLLAAGLAASLLVLSACQDAPAVPAAPGSEPDPPYKENDMGALLEKNYVYMWQKDGLNRDKRRICLQSETYGLLVDGKTGKLIGAAAADPDAPYTECDADALPPVDMSFQLKNGDAYVTSRIPSEPCRIIDSGRYVDRLDNVSLKFSGMAGKTARVEYTATKTHVGIRYGLHSDEAGSFDLRFSLAIDGYAAAGLPGGEGVSLLDADGSGFAVIVPQGQDGAAVTVEGDTVYAECRGVSVQENTFSHFGVVLIPVRHGSMTAVEEYLATAQAVLTAETPDGSALPVHYDSLDGIFYVDTDGISVGPQTVAENRTALERVRFSIRNDSPCRVEPTVCFTKEKSNFSVTGMSPVIRDAGSGEPTGEQVQISKNWHVYSSSPEYFNYASVTDPKQICSGQWYHGYLTLGVSGKESVNREYVCAYGNWGSVYAVSHAQLCLVGYGGNQLWEESALGSWGESITYDPDIGLGRSMVDDVRPFLCTAPTGGGQEYNWTGNVGGAQFLKKNIVDQKITYRTQAPCLTHVNYSGETSDGRIRTDITINMGRTDDAVRSYYTILYEFAQDCTLRSPLCLFKIAADGYADNQYRRYAYGDASGIFEKDVGAAVRAGYGGSVRDAEDDAFWFALYDSSSADENGNVIMIVREFEATLNGETYDKPGFMFYGTNNGTQQMSCELTLPSAVGKKVEKGSAVRLVVEYAVVPADINTYYGSSAYLLADRDLMGTAEALYAQVTGAALSVSADVGAVVSEYPVYIRGSRDRLAARFTLEGGLGYVPVTIGSLGTYKNWQLEYRDGEEWRTVDQSVNGSDYWQTYYDARTGTYELTYNVNNTAKTEYRLIQK